MIDLSKLLSPYTRAVIVGGIQINNKLVKAGLTWEDVEGYNGKNKSISQTRAIITKSCPVCGKPMRCYPVNTSNKKEDIVGEGLNSQWLCGTSCSGKGCLYEEFSTNTVEEEYKLLMENK